VLQPLGISSGIGIRPYLTRHDIEATFQATISLKNVLYLPAVRDGVVLLETKTLSGPISHKDL
jgi:hypothetical protein